jgi:MFS transporter, DHA2 family, multidrug resistance protein
MILMAVCLGCLDYVLEEGARWEWFSDDTIRVCAWTAALAGAGFVIRSLTYARPIVDLRAFASRNFTLGCWFSFVTGVGTFGPIYLPPLFLGHVRGFIAWQISGAILWAGPFQLATVPIYSFLANRSICGCCCCRVGMLRNLAVAVHAANEPMGLGGNASRHRRTLRDASTVTLTMGDLPPDRLKSASGLFALMRNLGGVASPYPPPSSSTEPICISCALPNI